MRPRELPIVLDDLSDSSDDEVEMKSKIGVR